MKPQVIDYLKTHSFEQLELEHGVVARPNKTLNKFSINYDQILAKSSDPLANECRGMVIRPKNALTSENWQTVIVDDVELVAWPMNRFFNHGDVACAPVNWNDSNSLNVYEKLDGTCCILYWDQVQEEWCVATRSVPEADLPIREDHMEIGNMTFSGLFWKSVLETIKRSEFPGLSIEGWKQHLVKTFTYVFELTTPFNRVVVKYDDCAVALLAVRRVDTGIELNPALNAKLLQVNVPQTWSINDPISLAAFVDNCDPSKIEGAVVCDSSFNRVKVKNKSWVLSSKAKDLVTVSRRSALEAILQGKLDDILPLIEKDIADQLISMQSSAQEYFAKLDANFHKWKAEATGSRKNFAEKVISSGDWSPPYFNMWEGRAATVTEWVEKQALAEKLSSSTLDLILSKIGQATVSK